MTSNHHQIIHPREGNLKFFQFSCQSRTYVVCVTSILIISKGHSRSNVLEFSAASISTRISSNSDIFSTQHTWEALRHLSPSGWEIFLCWSGACCGKCPRWPPAVQEFIYEKERSAILGRRVRGVCQPRGCAVRETAGRSTIHRLARAGTCSASESGQALR